MGRPLYLRGAWHADQLRFNGAGTLLSKSEVGPFTLAGVEVKRVTFSGDSLVIKGVRTALVRRADGLAGLERRLISSTTHISYSLRRGDKQNYHAPDEMQITIEPDAAGKFDTALSRIFADGLAELTPFVPLYWKCYALNYFSPAVISANAADKVKECVTTPHDPTMGEAASSSNPGMLPPVLIGSAPVRAPGIAGELRVRGSAIVHLRVTTEGLPVGLQVVQALGAGLDEAALQAVSGYRFRPATLDGVPVPVDLNVNVQSQ